MLDNKAWLQEQVQSKPLRHIAKELGVPYSRVQATIKKLEIELPKRTKYFYTEESRKAKSEAVKAGLAKRYPEGRFGEGASNWRGGLPLCMDCGRSISRKDAKRCLNCERVGNRQGENNHNWRGGISPENMKVRSSKEYRAWRKAVLERDNYTCQICTRSREEEPTLILHADHIKSFAQHPELRVDRDNGRTLCIDCHRETDSWGGTPKTIIDY